MHLAYTIPTEHIKLMWRVFVSVVESDAAAAIFPVVVVVIVVESCHHTWHYFIRSIRASLP